MKILKAVLAVMIIALVAVSIGCSKKKDNPTAPSTPTTTTTQLPTTQQATVAGVAAGNVTTNINEMSDMAGSMTSGSTFVPAKGGKTPPDTGWHAYSSGWYYRVLNEEGFFDTLYIRFTPDIWGASPGAKVTRYEYLMHASGIYNTTTYTWNMDGLAQYMTDTTMIEGHWYYGYNLVLANSGYNFDYSYSWRCNYDNVSILNGNHSCHFTYTCVYPFYDAGTPTAMSHTDLSGEMKLDANGYGSLGTGGYAGFCATNSFTFVKFYSTAAERYYTLAGDGFVAHHTW